MIRIGMFALVVSALALLPGQQASGQKKGWYDKAVKKFEAKFEPAEAKPGQTVVLKITIDLNEGFHTYPTVQPDKAAESFVNRIKFAEPGNVIFVGTTTDPKDFEKTADPELKIKELRVLSDTVTYSRKAVVSPKAAAGMLEVKVGEFQLQVCQGKLCFPGKSLMPTAMLKVLDGPAAPVEKDFADEVKKALEK